MAIAEQERTELARPPHARRHVPAWLPVLVWLACFGVFAAIQLSVERKGNSYWLSTPDYPAPRFIVDWHQIRYQLGGDLARFIALSLACAALIAARRRVFWLPAIAYFAAPLLIGWNDSECAFFGWTPAAVGFGWRTSAFGCPSEGAAGWAPASLELGLVLAPIFVLAIARSAKRAGPGEVRSEISAFRVAGLCFAAFTLWAEFWAWRLAGTMWFPPSTRLSIFLPLLAFGLALATLRPRLAWTLPVVAALLATDWPSNLAQGYGLDGLRSTFPSMWPYLAIPVIAASWRPLSLWLEGLRRSPRSALVALNALNVADALLTSFAVHREGAAEVNPFVRLIGLPAKLALVVVLSFFLFRVRPRVLPWLVLALTGVLAWHIAGAFASPR